jgi:hypothetical protein
MLFFSFARFELVRLGLRELARAVAVDAEPTSRHRSGRQHLRNGLGALVSVASDVGVHGSLPASIWLASRDPARSELNYALSELRSARPASGFASRHRVVLALTLVGSAGLGWRTKTSAS